MEQNKAPISPVGIIQDPDHRKFAAVSQLFWVTLGFQRAGRSVTAAKTVKRPVTDTLLLLLLHDGCQRVFARRSCRAGGGGDSWHRRGTEDPCGSRVARHDAASSPGGPGTLWRCCVPPASLRPQLTPALAPALPSHEPDALSRTARRPCLRRPGSGGKGRSRQRPRRAPVRRCVLRRRRRASLGRREAPPGAFRNSITPCALLRSSLTHGNKPPAHHRRVPPRPSQSSAHSSETARSSSPGHFQGRTTLATGTPAPPLPAPCSTQGGAAGSSSSRVPRAGRRASASSPSRRAAASAPRRAPFCGTPIQS